MRVVFVDKETVRVVMRKHVKIVQRINVVRDSENYSAATTAAGSTTSTKSCANRFAFFSPHMQIRADSK